MQKVYADYDYQLRFHPPLRKRAPSVITLPAERADFRGEAVSARDEVLPGSNVTGHLPFLSSLPQNWTFCKPAYETRNKRPGEHVEWWNCFHESFHFDFAELVDLNWPNIEKVWVDMNFISGQIPPDIDQRWPKLQSLDVYDNLMTGPIPEALGRLPLTKLQMQANDFSGELPQSLVQRMEEIAEYGRTSDPAEDGLSAFNLSCEQFFHIGLSDNPRLRGCVPARSSFSSVGLTNTNVTLCGVDVDGEPGSSQGKEKAGTHVEL